MDTGFLSFLLVGKIVERLLINGTDNQLCSSKAISVKLPQGVSSVCGEPCDDSVAADDKRDMPVIDEFSLTHHTVVQCADFLNL